MKQLISSMLSVQPTSRPSIQEALVAIGSPILVPLRTPTEVIAMLFSNTEAYWYCKLSGEKIKRLYSEYSSVVQAEAELGNPTAMLRCTSQAEFFKS